MSYSASRRTALKGLALAAPLLAVAPAAFADSTTPPGGHHPTPPGGHHPTPPGGHHPTPPGGHHPTPPAVPTHPTPGGQVPLPPGCHEGTWMQDIPCAHFTDQSNGEGWCFGNTVTLTLDASAGRQGYDVQCYLIPVSGDYSRCNTSGNARERFRGISRSYYSSRNFCAGNWSAPCDVSGLTLPFSYDGYDSGRQTITLPHGSIMVQSNNVCFDSTQGVGKLQLQLGNRWFSSAQSWLKAVWVIKNKSMGHWHVLDTVGVAGCGSRSGYDGCF